MRDISLREIADATKISVRYLEALEQNRFDILPGGLFNKGFIRAYAAFIGADGDGLVDTYLQEIAAREQAAAGAVEVGRPGAGGLHRPAEAPKRRASPDLGVALPGVSGNGQRPESQPAPAQPRAPDVDLEKLAAVIDERRAMERLASGRGRRRLLAVVGSFAGGAALIFALLLVARAVTRSPASAEMPREATAGLLPPPQATAAPEPTPPQESPEDPVAGGATAAPLVDQAADTAAVNRPAAPPASAPVENERRDETTAGRARAPASIPLPPPAPESAAAMQREKTPARGAALSPMDLRLEAISPVLVQVSCDGEDRLNRPLLPGEMATMRCFNLIRVSATDAAALRLVVNGQRCATLGEPGSRVQGFAIRIDDVGAICPSSGGASDARR